MSNDSEQRFFMDHGMIHDRKTGRHVEIDPQYGGVDALELLNELAATSPSIDPKERAQPVGEVHRTAFKERDELHSDCHLYEGVRLPLGTKLYAHPPASIDDSERRDAERIEWIELAIRKKAVVWFMPCGPDLRFVQVRQPGGEIENYATVPGVRAAIDAAIDASKGTA